MTAQQIWQLARKCGLDALGLRAASAWPFPVRVTVNSGREMFVDLRSSIGRGLFATGQFDMEAINPALAALEPGATFIDVGANVGFYSLLALDRVGPTGNVYSFEIDPRPLRCLRKTVAAHGITNLHVVEAAVSDKNGVLSYSPKAEHGHNQIDLTGRIRGPTIRSVRLDDWLQENGVSRVDVIKVDVEGAEKFVLAGAKNTIAKFKPLLLCEADEKTTNTFGYKPAELKAQLDAFGYRTKWLERVHTPTILAIPA